jgi:hypothetical protein
MEWFDDRYKRKIRLTDERLAHIESDHPEMSGQINKIGATLTEPDIIIRSRTDPEVELFYRYYEVTPVGEKYMCVVTRVRGDASFIITAYFTDAIKRGDVLWEKK